jgi:hypothetical protein
MDEAEFQEIEDQMDEVLALIAANQADEIRDPSEFELDGLCQEDWAHIDQYFAQQDEDEDEDDDE